MPTVMPVLAGGRQLQLELGLCLLHEQQRPSSICQGKESSSPRVTQRFSVGQHTAHNQSLLGARGRGIRPPSEKLSESPHSPSATVQTDLGRDTRSHPRFLLADLHHPRAAHEVEISQGTERVKFGRNSFQSQP